jgi:transcriptional regulator with XRE-family HTH domain
MGESKVGARFRRARRAAKLSRRAVAEACGISPDTVFRLESGKGVSIVTAEAVASACGMYLALVEKE